MFSLIRAIRYENVNNNALLINAKMTFRFLAVVGSDVDLFPPFIDPPNRKKIGHSVARSPSFSVYFAGTCSNPSIMSLILNPFFKRILA